MRPASLRAITRVLPFLLAAPGFVYVQPVLAQAPTRAEAQAAASNVAPSSYTVPQIDQMLAPIALYPDQLLTEVLMAATFPDQLIDAQKWLQDSGNAALKGDDLAKAVEPLPWDASVKSLVAFPQIVTMLTQHLDWAESLGVAFANQQVQMMARVQVLRERAVSSGHLQTSKQLVVRHEASQIIIEPPQPDTIYVPVYNPAVAYGAWPDRGAPPVYIPPPPDFYAGPVVGGVVGAAIGFSVGYGVAHSLWGWGHPDWGRHEVIVDPDRYRRIGGPTNVTVNQITVNNNNVWQRTQPVALVPEAQRPRPAAAIAAAPAGTVLPTALQRPRPVPGQLPAAAINPAAAAGHPGAALPGVPTPVGPAAMHPPGEGPRPGEGLRPGEGGPHPGEGPHAGEGLHPGGEGPHPGGEGPHPGEAHVPTAVAQPPAALAEPHPEARHPPGEGPHPGEAHVPAAVAQPPAALGERHPEAHHPPGEGPHPGEAHVPAAAGPPPAALAQPPHPPAAAIPHPAAEAPHVPPAAAIMHPPGAPAAEIPHPPAAAMHPPGPPAAEIPHPPAAAVAHPPAPPHPPAAAMHPPAPAAAAAQPKPPGKPGEAEKKKDEPQQQH